MAGPAHPLDRPVWAALTSRHARFAEGTAAALRYPAAVAPFAATVDDTPASLEALAALLAPGATAALVLAEDLQLKGPFELLLAKTIDQMLATGCPEPSPRTDLVPLGAADVAAMTELVELTRPGPFLPRTHELGTYLGVRDGGRLAALAGERMQLDGFTEISAVCTHPEHRGRGHARALMTVLMRAAAARGDTPFLHVLSENAAAIALYQELGFRLRRRVHFTVFRRL